MTEKQRWLLRELEEWSKEQMRRIGSYGPLKEPMTPTRVKAAIKAMARHQATIKQWDREKRRPWERKRDVIAAMSQRVKRSILFEKTDVALSEIRKLPK